MLRLSKKFFQILSIFLSVIFKNRAEDHIFQKFTLICEGNGERQEAQRSKGTKGNRGAYSV
jgi:hypothetical protein